MPSGRRLHTSARSLPLLLALVLGLLAGLAAPALAQVDDAPAGGGLVEILPVEGFVDPPVAGAIRDVVALAEADGSALVVVQIASGGGVEADVQGLFEVIRNATVPVAVLVGPSANGARAEGAAAVLAAAAPILSVAPDATVGPAEPADFAAPDVDAAALLDRVLTADGAAVLDGSLSAAEVLASGGLSADQLALDVGDLGSLLVELDGRTVVTAAGEVTLDLPDSSAVRFHSLGLVRRALHAATTPAFIYLLLVFGLGMLIFEAFQPGFGVAGLAGLVLLAVGVFGLTVLPITWWALVLLLAGLALFAVDAAVAGFGPITLAATASFGAGSAFLYDHPRLELNTWLVVATTLAAVAFFVVVLTVILRAQAGPDDVSVDHLVGKVGVVRSVLNPEGHVYVDGALWRARWDGPSKRAKVGLTIRVTGVDGPMVVVEPFEAPADV